MEASGIKPKSVRAAFYSTVAGHQLDNSEELKASYWCRNLKSPVLFNTTVAGLLENVPAHTTFLEIGPHSALAGPLRQIATHTARSMNYVPTLVRNLDAHAALLRTAGALFQMEIPIDLSPVISVGQVLTDLPTYAWHHEGRYWLESRQMKGYRMRQFPYHDSLGLRVEDANDLEPTWRNVVRIADVPWIRDHDILGELVFPGAGYVSIAGEAIRQLTGSTDFSVRNVNIVTAMVMDEMAPTEIITQFRPARLTTTLNSNWYDFTVASYRNGVWTRNCTGQARAGREFDLELPHPVPGARMVEPAVWYRVMKRFGFNYGPRFRGLKNITAGVSENKATAEVDNFIDKLETQYAFHPCTIDYIFQLFSVAARRGIPRLFDYLAVPTYIEELYISPPTSTVSVQTTANARDKGAFSGDAVGYCGDKLVFHVKNIRLSQLTDGEEVRGVDPHAGSQIVWKPDIDYVDVGTLMRPQNDPSVENFVLEELALTCMVETESRLRHLAPSQPHFARFYDWLKAQRARAETNSYDHVPNSAAIVEMSADERVAHVAQLLANPVLGYGKTMTTAINRIFEAAVPIFEGNTNPIDLLLKDDVLADTYAYGQRCCDYGDFLKVLGHSRPNMKILEIGAGTGGMTSTILPLLKNANGDRLYGSYTYTDISAGFFVSAKERFQAFDQMSFNILDISANPLMQGFEKGHYDLIVASNVLHATPDLHQTLLNVGVLLKPNGKLFLQELSPITKWINYVMGVLPGWWLGEADNRPDEPYVGADRWDLELKKAGFVGAESVVHDGHFNAHIVSRLQETWLNVQPRISLLRTRSHCPPVDSLTDYLQAHGYQVEVVHLGDKIPHGQPIVSVLDLDGPFVHAWDAQAYEDFRQLLWELDGSSMLWITQSCQVLCKDPRYAPILGLARTIRNELSLNLFTLELDSFDDAAWAATTHVVSKASQPSFDAELDATAEFAYASGHLLVGKFNPVVVGDQLTTRGAKDSVKQFNIGKRGFLQTLGWRPQGDIQRPADWVEIDTRAVGLNFKDVLIAMGIVDGQSLGVECAGVVRAAAPGVTHLTKGDRVIVFGGGCFSSTLVTSARLCAKMAPKLDFVEAAALPCVFATVIYSLLYVARLRAGQTVLIHSACGGIGLAAIQICRMIGAKIFCTVGSPGKVEYLTKTVGVPEERIFNSRDNTFLRDIMSATQGRGVDVVLNSLSGELLHASWKCVAEFGVMVEIGKRDFIGKGKLAMDLFESNRSFVGVDFGQICLERPEITQNLLERLMDYYEQGHISPAPITKFEAATAEQAFRFMQKGSHIGKIVVTMPENAEEIPVTPAVVPPKFRADGCHIIIGGLGGLGRSVSSWMVMHGARHLVMFSRSADRPGDHDKYIQELRAQGVRVDLISGDVTDPASVDAMIAGLDTNVAGVMQASMVLKDVAFPEMTFDDWQTAVLPKIQGTWNLHHSMERHNRQTLDYSVLFSSWSGLVGHWGQANYAAGNTFLDAFVQYRHTLNLPCSAINIGLMEDIGYVSRNEHILEHFRSTATHALQEQNLLDTIQYMIDQSLPANNDRLTEDHGFTSAGQVCIGLRTTLPLNSPANRTVWKRDPRMAIYHNLSISSGDGSGSGSAEDEALKQFLLTAHATPAVLSQPPAADFLAKETGRTLFGFMLRDVEDMDVAVSLASTGVDSLVAIELRNWFRLKLGIDVTVLEILGGASLGDLGRMSAERMVLKRAAAHATDGASGSDAQEAAEEAGNSKAVEEESIRDRYLNMKAP
ncbi:putative polyketide synthase [Cladophialophora carrionii]|uniref:Putative polyketide synthase n=1 Tax=Cladophialophora carrionii TaxID=86049 RepID=A0A1C1CZ59_9EURO|nr:putative polyketide synthase [Cladophialophora carrionii]